MKEKRTMEFRPLLDSKAIRKIVSSYLTRLELPISSSQKYSEIQQMYAFITHNKRSMSKSFLQRITTSINQKINELWRTERIVLYEWIRVVNNDWQTPRRHCAFTTTIRRKCHCSSFVSKAQQRNPTFGFPLCRQHLSWCTGVQALFNLHGIITRRTVLDYLIG